MNHLLHIEFCWLISPVNIVHDRSKCFPEIGNQVHQPELRKWHMGVLLMFLSIDVLICRDMRECIMNGVLRGFRKGTFLNNFYLISGIVFVTFLIDLICRRCTLNVCFFNRIVVFIMIPSSWWFGEVGELATNVPVSKHFSFWLTVFHCGSVCRIARQ